MQLKCYDISKNHQYFKNNKSANSEYFVLRNNHCEFRFSETEVKKIVNKECMIYTPIYNGKAETLMKKARSQHISLPQEALILNYQIKRYMMCMPEGFDFLIFSYDKKNQKRKICRACFINNIVKCNDQGKCERRIKIKTMYFDIQNSKTLENKNIPHYDANKTRAESSSESLQTACHRVLHILKKEFEKSGFIWGVHLGIIETNDNFE